MNTVNTVENDDDDGGGSQQVLESDHIKLLVEVNKKKKTFF